MINNCTLMGRLVSDPELKKTPAGVSVTSFRIAVERDYVSKDGNREADYITIICWRQTAEFVCRYFGKGNMIAIQGKLQTRTYQDSEKKNHYLTEVIADKASFTGEKSNHQQATPQQQAAPQQAAPQQAAPQQAAPQQQAFTDMDMNVDDLPF